MRKLVLTLIAAATLLVIAWVIAIFSLNRILAANREAILAQVAAVAGRPVRAGEIVVRFGFGIGIGLTRVEVGEDPAFGSEPFLTAEELTARVRLWPLLRRRLEVGRVTLSAPTVRVIRSADGRWNYESLGRAEGLASHAAGVRRVAAVEILGAPAGALALVIDSAFADDGTVVLLDRSAPQPSTTRARDVDLRLFDLSVDQPIGFRLSAAVSAERQNVELTGMVGPLAQRARLPVIVQGKLGPFGAADVAVDGLDLRAFVTPREIEVEHIGGNALSGTFGLTGSWALDRGGPVRLAGELRAIHLDQLLALGGESPRQPIEGEGTLQLDVQGTTGPDLAHSLVGAVDVTVVEGVVREFNLVRELFKRVTGVAGLGEIVSKRIAPKYGRLLTGDDTRFDDIHATLRIAGGRIETDDMTVTAEDFGVRAAGWFTIDRDIDMRGTLRMSRRFSDDVVADVKEIKYVLDEGGQLSIPFRLRGKLGHAKPKPDGEYLERLLERAVKRGAAGHLIQQLLGKKRRAGATPDSDDSADEVERRLHDLFGP